MEPTVPTGCHVHALEDGGWFNDGFARGALTDVTLRWGNEFARCDGILIWDNEPEEVLEEYFQEWQAAAERGEEGYSSWVNEPRLSPAATGGSPC